MVSRLKQLAQKVSALAVMSMMLSSCQDTLPARTTISPDLSQTTGGTTGGGEAAQPTRPDNAVKFKTGYCGCKDTKAITYGNCASFCAGKNTNGAGVLFATFNVTEEISLNPELVTLKNWCNKAIGNEESNPSCVLQAKDDEGNSFNLPVDPGSSNSSLQINIDRLSEDKTYILTLVETTSNSKSDTIQIIKFSEDIPLSLLGPLKNAPISQYTCINRPAPDDGGDNSDIYYDVAFRVHLYFLPRIPPQPVAAGSDFVCHDFMNPLYGAIDDILFPRLEQLPGIFNLWDTMDPRFYDNNGNGNDDVNDIVNQKAKNFGAVNIPASQRYFVKFPQMASIETNEEGGATASVAQSMGYYMPYWLDSNYKSYCLNNTHYNSSNPLFKALRDIVGVEMEGIYVGVKTPETIFDRYGNPLAAPDDFLLIRETDLKAVWFYMKNGVPTVPTEAIVSTVPVFFYYPLNRASPFVKSSTQRIYQVKGAPEIANEEVQEGGANTSGSSSTYPSHDRKLGCIPKF